MTRTGTDLYAEDGSVWLGYDYNLQVWVRDGIVLACSHPESMRVEGPCCTQDAYEGRRVREIEGHETRAANVRPHRKQGDLL